MTQVRLAHCSDIHVTHFPLTAAGGFALKRLVAVGSYSVAGRGAHFADSDTRIAALLNDVDALNVDHAICTGDLTGVSTETEFAEVAARFGPVRLARPERYTVIPGNHDRYVAEAQGRFERYFGSLCDGGRFPLVKALSGNVTLVCVDAARPTNLVDSSGLIGTAQRAKLLQILADASLRDQFVVLGFHYGLLRMNGQRDGRNHGLRDDTEMLALIDRPEVSLDLVIHGHLHRPFKIRPGRRTIVNAGSATDLHVDGAGFNVYDIDAAAHHITISRRAWSTPSGAYVEDVASPVCGEFTTR